MDRKIAAQNSTCALCKGPFTDYNDVSVVGKFLSAQRALPVLQGDLAIHQIPHLAVGPEFPVLARVIRIVDAADAALADSPLFGNRFSATAEAGVMNGTNLGATKPHASSSYSCGCSKAHHVGRLALKAIQKTRRARSRGRATPRPWQVLPLLLSGKNGNVRERRPREGELQSDPRYRVPCILVDQNGIRPVDLAIVDGIETVRGGEGPWFRGLTERGTSPFIRGDNSLQSADGVAAAIIQVVGGYCGRTYV